MNKKILLMALCAFFCQLTISHVFAVKATPFPITFTQPDGNQLTIRLHGDEFNHFQTTEDGYLLKENSKGFLTYATVNVSGAVIESDIVAQNINKRTAIEIQFINSTNKDVVIQTLQSTRLKSKMLLSGTNKPHKAYPLIGAPKALVILANFKDKKFVVSSPKTSFQNLVTQSGYSANGGTGSAKDYFMASSYGKFAPDFIVTDTVTLPQTLDYYGKNSGGTAGNDTNPVQMIVDACAAADAAGLDFTQFDTDGDGYVDNVFVYYAGYNEAEGGPENTIWPHRWSISDAGITKGITFDGKIINDYSCTSELKGNSGTNMCGVGTFCHEFGHVLGLPDYYDTSGSSAYTATLETWEIMDYGPYLNGGNTPPSYSAWDRFFLGYLTPQLLNSPTVIEDTTLLPLYQGTTQPAYIVNQAYLIASSSHNLNGAAPSPAEFFLVEYRKHTGWDTYLGQNIDSNGNLTTIPSDGMCIWHIDYLQSAWDENTPNNYTGSTQTASSHMRVYLQPLSGQTTTPGTTFTTGSFTPTTWSGTDINRAITNITKTNDTITFKFMPPKMSTTGSFIDFSTTLGAISTNQNLNVSALNLAGNLSVTLQNSTNFDIKLSTDASWSKSLSLVPISGSVTATLQVRLNPIITGTLKDQLNISGSGLTATNFDLTGTATIGPNSPVIFADKIDNTLAFSVTKINTTNTKTINLKSTDLNNNLNFVITGANTGMFNVTVSSVTKDAANSITGTNITINYLPTTTGTHTATITISGGGLNPDKVITLTGSGI